MEGKKDRKKVQLIQSVWFRSMITSFTAIAALLGSILASSSNSAEAASLVSPQEHWKYNVMWIWDSDMGRSVGLVMPKIVIQNGTNDRIEGYIADQNGTRLTMYDDQQVVMVRFELKSGFLTDWDMNDNKMHDGLFVIDIPDAYKGKLGAVRIYIGNNDYTVGDGTRSSPHSLIFINSARLDYKVGTAPNVVPTSTVSPTTLIAQTNEGNASTLTPANFGGSLIDYILNTAGG